MKVLWIVNGMLPDFSRALSRRAGNTGGWMPSLIAAIRHHAPGVALYVVCEADGDFAAEYNGVHYYSFKRFSLPIPGYSSRRNRFCGKLRRLVAEIRPDVIHFHGTENGYMAFPEMTWCGVPRVVSLQGVITGYYPHFLGGLTSRQLFHHRNWMRWLLLRHDLAFGADSWREHASRIERMGLVGVRHIAGRTVWDRAWAKALAPDAQYHHVGEVLRPEFYDTTRKVAAIKPHSILASAAVKYPLKGGHWLLEAVAYLKRKYPDITVKFVDAESKIHPRTLKQRLQATDYHHYIRHLVSNLGIEENVIFLPGLDASGVVEELRSAEVFCLPSMVENSPNSLGEAQLIGVPVVATDVGGNSSMVENGISGLLVPSGDAAALAFGISELFEKPDFATKLAVKAREVALLRHNDMAVVSDLVKCYKEVVGNG